MASPIPMFAAEGDDAYWWILCIEKYFNVWGTPEVAKLPVAVTALRGPALQWCLCWYHYHPQASWESFITPFLWRFKPEFEVVDDRKVSDFDSDFLAYSDSDSSENTDADDLMMFLADENQNEIATQEAKETHKRLTTLDRQTRLAIAMVEATEVHLAPVGTETVTFPERWRNIETTARVTKIIDPVSRPQEPPYTTPTPAPPPEPPNRVSALPLAPPSPKPPDPPPNVNTTPAPPPKPPDPSFWIAETTMPPPSSNQIRPLFPIAEPISTKSQPSDMLPFPVAKSGPLQESTSYVIVLNDPDAPCVHKVPTPPILHRRIHKDHLMPHLGRHLRDSRKAFSALRFNMWPSNHGFYQFFSATIMEMCFRPSDAPVFFLDKSQPLERNTICVYKMQPKTVGHVSSLMRSTQPRIIWSQLHPTRVNSKRPTNEPASTFFPTHLLPTFSVVILALQSTMHLINAIDIFHAPFRVRLGEIVKIRGFPINAPLAPHIYSLQPPITLPISNSILPIPSKMLFGPLIVQCIKLASLLISPSIKQFKGLPQDLGQKLSASFSYDMGLNLDERHQLSILNKLGHFSQVMG